MCWCEARSAQNIVAIGGMKLLANLWQIIQERHHGWQRTIVISALLRSVTGCALKDKFNKLVAAMSDLDAIIRRFGDGAANLFVLCLF